MDFWAGLVSGAAGIIIGNPLDIIKVQLQIRKDNHHNIGCSSCNKKLNATTSSFALLHQVGGQQYQNPRIQFWSSKKISRNDYRKNNVWLSGIAAPILGYGGLNGLLFITYNRFISLLNNKDNVTFSTTNTSTTSTSTSTITATTSSPNQNDDLLWTTFVAGAVGGLATWIISTPTELIKCRAQAHAKTYINNNHATQTSPSPPPHHHLLQNNSSTNNISSWKIAKSILRHEGIRGLYFGGVITALRDSIGYGFYFWTYKFTTSSFSQLMDNFSSSSSSPSSPFSVPSIFGNKDVEVIKMLICGGIAGIATWVSVFPLDLIKTRVQTQLPDYELLKKNKNGNSLKIRGRMTAMQIFQSAYTNETSRVFFQGMGVCCVRAFLVNAVQWSIYELIMQRFNDSHG